MGAERETRRRKLSIAAMLTWISGCIDAVGFAILHRVFTANMSGDTIHMGIYWGQGRWSRGAELAFAIGMFLCGALLAEVVVQEGRLRGWRATLALALGLEALLLVSFAAVAWTVLGVRPQEATPPWFSALIALAAGAMGAQNASMRHAGAVTIHTTHVTGGITRIARELGAAWALVRRRRAASKELQPGKALSRLGGLAAMWLGYLGGAVFGTWGVHYFGLPVLGAPLILLGAVIALALVWRLPVAAERDEAWWSD